MKTYFILDEWNRAIKIGRSLNPEKRLTQLQTGHASTLRLLHIIEGDHEKLFHARWSNLRVNGEWFKVDGDLRLYLGLQLGIFKPNKVKLKATPEVIGRRKAEKSKKLKDAPWDYKHPSLMDDFQASPLMRGKIAHDRHVAILGRAFIKYRNVAERHGLTILSPFPTLSDEEEKHPIQDHQTRLNEARRYYAEQLTALVG